MSHPIPGMDYHDEYEHHLSEKKKRGMAYKKAQENSPLGKLKKAVRESKKTRTNALLMKISQ